MKFRTDFVTNSSDSSFIAFRIQNKDFCAALTALGLQLKNAENGILTDNTVVVLPSGKEMMVDSETWDHPYVDEFNGSISAWFIGALLHEVGDYVPPLEEEEYEDETKELIAILRDANVFNADWALVESWSRENMISPLSERFGPLDSHIEEAVICHTYAFEGEAGPVEHVEVRNGRKLTISYKDEESFETKDCEDLTFVITGKLNHFENREELVELIEELGGNCSESVTKKTSYLICNDLESETSKMKKARELCVPVITEDAFMRMFSEDACDENDEDEYLDFTDDIMNIDDINGFYDLFSRGGIGSTSIEVWKKNHWEAL